MKRINFWDFDDVLADSSRVVSRLKALPENRDVLFWAWWHDPKFSTAVALETPPLLSGWELLRNTPGEHRILTARCIESVTAWLEKHGLSEVFTQVISTSKRDHKHIPACIKKTWHVQAAIETEAASIYFYDDTLANILEMRERCPECTSTRFVGI